MRARRRRADYFRTCGALVALYRGRSTRTLDGARLTMKFAAFALTCLLTVQQTLAADQPFIPTELNRILPQIRTGMTVSVVEDIIRSAYPGMTALVGDWSGGGGTILYKLDDHYTLAIACEEIGDKRLVHTNVRFVIYERPANRRVTLSLYEWKE
jgi:hypothetical protein